VKRPPIRAPISRISLVAAAVATALAGAGCTHTVQVGAGRTVHVALTEYRVNPNSIVARAGKLTIVARNFGRMTHNVTVIHGSTVLRGTAPIPPGRTASVTLRLAPGTYTMASTILSDQALGQFGTLKITR
jgi:Cupredoxin-like domain